MLAFTRDVVEILDYCQAYVRTLSLIIILWGENPIDETLLLRGALNSHLEWNWWSLGFDLA